MPKQIVKDNIWRSRIIAADKYYKQWEGLFKCELLEDYYENRQWRFQESLNYSPYVINKVYETIQIKIAEFIPTFPEFLVSSIPSAEEYDLESAASAANIKQDVLNTLIQADSVHFTDEATAAYRDAYFRFGIIEVGYAADWILNPNAQKPLLGKDTDQQLSGKKAQAIKQEPEVLPVDERIYFKCVNAKRFRVGGMDSPYLERCGWYGYYEFVHRDDILSLKNIMNRDKVENASGFDGGDSENNRIKDRDGLGRHDSANYLKIWHLWDNRSGNLTLFLDQPGCTIYQKEFKRKAIFDYRFDKRTKVEGFYPIPPVFRWMSPQNEINETREALRIHRKRFVRKFQVLDGAIDDPELEKFENGPDGALIKVTRENAISIIQDGNVGPELTESASIASNDFNEISGTSNQDRQVSDRGTATEATYINQRAEMRGNKERDLIVKWLVGIGREALLLAREKFTLGIWAKVTSPEGKFLGIAPEKTTALKWVSTEDLNDGFDFKIQVDVTSISAAAQDDEKKKFFEFLAGMNQFPQIAFSPLMVRELAYRVGYRNEAVIKEAQKMALTMEIGRQMQMQQAMGGGAPQPGGNAGQTIAQNNTPPAGEQARNQLVPQNGGVVQ